MKTLLTGFCILCLFCCYPVIYSQKLNIGAGSGIGFSDIRGQESTGKWEHKPGPIQGILAGYSFNKHFGIQTGIDFATNYYEHKTYYPGRDFYAYLSSSVLPDYYSATDNMNFSFIRIPLLLDLTVPSVIQFDLKAGFYYSFLQNYSLRFVHYYPEPLKHDFGYILSSGISYPFADHFRASFSVGHLTGIRGMFDIMDYKHGSSEFRLGISYNGFFSGKSSETEKDTITTAPEKLSVTCYGGLNISWNASSTYQGKYTDITGPSLGFTIDYNLGRKASVRSGLSLERKGYSFKDSSVLYYRYLQRSTKMYFVNTRIETDYLVIPALLHFNIGKSDLFFINTGLWLGIMLDARCTGEAFDETRTEYSYRYRKTMVYDDMGKLLKATDFGWIAGAGLSLPLKNDFKLDIAIRYSDGLMDVFAERGFIDKPDKRNAGTVIKNRTISFLVGLKLPPARH